MLILTRRDFLKLGAMALGSLAFTPFLPPLNDFDDSNLVRVATKSVSVYSKPSDESLIRGQWFRDELVHVYEEVLAEKPEHNPVWYRVWGGYMHRGRLQRVKIILNEPMAFIPEGERRLAEVTVPFTQPWRSTKAYGWQPLDWRLYYESVHWIEAVEEGPDGEPWYRIFDDLVGAPYYALAIHLRNIPPDDMTPLNPEIPSQSKRIEVNLTTQTLTAFEYEEVVLQTQISSGVMAGRPNPKTRSPKTPTGEFHIENKYPCKHMGDGNYFADADDYELPGVPWTCFFNRAGEGESGVALHGTYWHENFGAPMSRGCVNMRTEEARWLFRWSLPAYTVERMYDRNNTPDVRGHGTLVNVFY